MLPRCPQCHAEINAEGLDATATVHCPSCQREISVSELARENTEDILELDLADNDISDDQQHDGSVDNAATDDFDLDLDALDDLEVELDDIEISLESNESDAPDQIIDPPEAGREAGTSDGFETIAAAETGPTGADSDVEDRIDEVDGWLTEDTKHDTELEAEDTLVETDHETSVLDEDHEVAMEARGVDETLHDELSGAFDFDGVFEEESTDHLESASDEKNNAEVEFEELSTAEHLASNANIEVPVSGSDSESPPPMTPVVQFESNATVAMGAAPLVPKRRNLLGSLLRIGVALLVLLPLLQVILWWAVGMDPLGMAGKLPGFLTFLAPTSLQNKPLAMPARPTLPQNTLPADDPSDIESGRAPDSEPEVNLVGESSESMDPPSEGSLNDTTGGATGTPVESNDLSTDKTETTAANQPADLEFDDGSLTFGDPPSTADPDNPLTVADDSPADLLEDRPTDDDVSDESGLDEDLSDILGAAPPPVVVEPSVFAGAKPSNAETYSRNDVAAMIARARKAHAAFEQGKLIESPDIKQLGREFYVAFCDLAQNSTYVSRNAADEILAESRALIGEVGREPKKPGLIARCAMTWLGDKQKAKRPPEQRGVLLAGTLKSIDQTGDVFEIQIGLMTPIEEIVTIVTRMDPSDNEIAEFGIGDQAVIMGVEVEQPAERIPGYRGNRPSVIYMTDQIVLMP